MLLVFVVTSTLVVTYPLALQAQGAPAETNALDDASLTGAWSEPFDLPVVPVGMDVLPDGRLLMLDDPAYSQQPIVFDPDSMTYITVPLASNLFCSSQAMLADGRLITIGGHGTSHLGITHANIFDAATNRWTRVADMHFPRRYPSTTTLGDGRLLVVSGAIDNGTWADTPEIYDPTTNTWSTIAVSTSDIHEIEYPLTFLMPTGRTLTMGVTNGHVDLLDAARATWTTLANAPTLNGTAAQYRPGKVLLTGGGPRNAASVLNASVLDTSQFGPAWQAVAPMRYPRFNHNLTLLADGNVMAIGGAARVTEYLNTGTLPTEMWNPTTNTWTTMAAVHEPRLYHSTSALLPDGRIVVGGGGSLAPNIDQRNVEFFSPPYLFKGPRPTIAAAPASTGYGQTFSVSTPDAAAIGKVTLIPLAAVTHTVDMGQRYLELAYTRGTGTLSVSAPADANSAPPGKYMLFVINSLGVPSVAAIVHLTGVPRFDTTVPTTLLTSPLPAAIVSGAVQLRATASDNLTVTDVQFLVDGSVVGHATSGSPAYSMTWDSTVVSNGVHSLTTRARDAAGNSAASVAVAVTVSNGSTSPTATPSAAPTSTSTSTLVPTPTSTATPLPLPATDVGIVNFAFQPSDLTVRVGQRVRWTNQGTVSHTTTSDDGAWDSGALLAGRTFDRVFSTVGDFDYHCAIHPTMTGTVHVVPLTPTPTATATRTPTPAATATPTPTPAATATPTPTLDPIEGTLGKTTIGRTIDSGDSDGMNGSRVVTGASPIEARSISVFVADLDTSLTNRSYQVAIYADVLGRPGALVAASATGALTANAWNTLPITADLAPNSAYWLMYNTNARTSATNNMRRDDGLPGAGAYSPNVIPFGGWPAAFGPANIGVWTWSIYLSY